MTGGKQSLFTQPGTPYEHDQWELFNLVDDFNESKDLSSAEPDRLSKMIELWWEQAELHQVLPLDDRFAERFAENADRHLGGRTFFHILEGDGAFA